jgi:hypothetical protein
MADKSTVRAIFRNAERAEDRAYAAMVAHWQTYPSPLTQAWHAEHDRKVDAWHVACAAAAIARGAALAERVGKHWNYRWAS